MWTWIVGFKLFHESRGLCKEKTTIALIYKVIKVIENEKYETQEHPRTCNTIL